MLLANGPNKTWQICQKHWQCHKLTLEPPWKFGGCISIKLLRINCFDIWQSFPMLTLLRKQCLSLRVLLETSPVVNNSMLLAHPMLSLLSRRMKQVISKDDGALRVALYSGHDLTLRPLLYALGFRATRWAASAIVVLVWVHWFLRCNGRVTQRSKEETSGKKFFFLPLRKFFPQYLWHLMLTVALTKSFYCFSSKETWCCIVMLTYVM